MHLNATTYRLEDADRLKKIPLILFLVGLAGGATYAATHSEQFYYSYLTAYLFWLGPALGGLFFTMLHHLTGSVWSIVLRKFAEAFAATIPALAVLFIPILFGLHDLYHWSHAEAVAADPLLSKKAGWLNPAFFGIRAALYLGIWAFLAWRLGKLSDRQDGGMTEELKSGFLKVSAPGMILFALTVSFASFDWMMSLNPHWYSTIFGVYYAMGSIMAFLGLLIVVVTRLQAKGILAQEITAEHRHDVGKLFFAFIILWAYMAFSQYFLIWYANLPEETIYYRMRWVGSWRTVSLLIVFGHFVVPFFALISRPAKRNPLLLGIIALWMLLMHWVDIYWNVAPHQHKEGAHISPADFTTMLLIGVVVFYFFWRRLASHPIIPVGDPKLADSLALVSK